MMTRRLPRWMGVTLALAITLAGCGRKHLVDPPHDAPQDPLRTGGTPAPLKPGSLTPESVGATSVSLRWTMSDSTGVASYRVYLQGPGDTGFRLAASPTLQRGSVTGLQTGSSYLFKVSGVNTAGLEGPASEAVAARLGEIGVLINSGTEFTSSATVTVQATAAGFNQIRLAARTDSLAAASWQNLVSGGLASFVLTGADGAKTVYAQFRDSNTGTESAVVSDNITLDRFAQILTVSENTLGAAKTAGQVIRFRLVAGERGGSATIDIGSTRTGIRLFNDGTNGDFVADDDTLAVDYVVEPTFDVNGAQITGRFTDRAGNFAAPVAAPGLVTIRNPPPAVTLQKAIRQSAGKVLLQWTESGASDFFSYRVWHAVGLPVLSSASPVLDTIITVRTSNTFVVSGLTGGTTYGFAIEVVDGAGNGTGSNELSTAALAIEPGAVATPSPEGAAPVLRERESGTNGPGRSSVPAVRNPGRR